jgi:hypothetical protein
VELNNGANGCKEQMGVDTIKGANKITLQKDRESFLIFFFIFSYERIFE